MTRRRLLVVAALAAAVVAVPLGADAQEDTLALRLRRTFGYAFGGDIQGSFELIAEGPVDLRRVRFFVDDSLLAEVAEAPYRARLHTGDYPLGPHRLWAEGDRQSGGRIISNEITANFVSASSGWDAAISMLKPVVLIVVVAVGVSSLFVFFASRRYRPGVYGTSGGAICPRCSLPLPRHWFSPNLVRGKLERCPHCRKWSVVPRARPDELEAAEARWRGEAVPASDSGDPGERLRRQIDDSRFTP
ncbi:MAG TPA: hypothetical protein VLL77_12755 [Anaerolineales bacterium]|nr:hypothetical protein [Anaerolineales bacterium]